MSKVPPNIAGSDGKTETLLPFDASHVQPIIDAMPGWVLLVDQDHKIVASNEAFARELTLDPEVVIGSYCPKLVHGTDSAYPGCPLELSVERSGIACEKEMYDADYDHWVKVVIYPTQYRHESGKRIFLHIAEDVTERRKAKDAQEQAERDMRTVINGAADAILVHDIASQALVEVNDVACVRLGFGKAELLRLPSTQVIGSADSFNVAWLASELQKRREVIFETSAVTRTGDRIDLEVNSRRIEFRGKPALLSVARDITERKQAEELRAQLEEQLRQSQKLEAVGRLAGGIAHDFNNLLTPILMASERGEETLDNDHPAHTEFEDIAKAAGRAAQLINQLKVFSRNEIVKKQLLSLNSVVIEVDSLLRRLLGESIKLEMPASPVMLGRIYADRSQLEQVVVNLAINARDAMPKGGTLTIQTTEVSVGDTPPSESLDMQPGKYVVLSVRDTGVGMSKEVQSRIFEPFFTSKDSDKGSGLGMAICYGIVKQSGGYIHVESELGRGTAITVYFPRVDPFAADDKETLESSDVPRGSETVLLVEDSSSVRNTTCRILRSLGYAVLDAATSRGALGVAEAVGIDSIQLLITDVIMPYPGGVELARRLRAQSPSLSVLFMTAGLDGPEGDEEFTELGTVLQKPFTITQLARAARDALGSV